MISYAAHHRKVVRQARRDQIRHEVREGLELVRRREAGDPEAIRQAEQNLALVQSYPDPAEDDYPEPLESEDDYPEPLDAEPWHALRPGESERRHRRRMGRPDLTERRAARLLARGYWDAGRPLPGAVRAALCALSLSPRVLRRLLAAIWDRPDWSPREAVPDWVPPLSDLPSRSGPGKVAHWLEVCLHTGPPAGTEAAVALISRTGGVVRICA